MYADPYSTVQARVIQPDAITPEITYAPISSTPSARLWCDSEVGPAEAINGVVTTNVVTFGKVAVATLDANTDGNLDDCTLEVSATDFETTTYDFGGATADGAAVSPLSPLANRYVDVPLIKVSTDPDIVRQPRGTLAWTDTGQDPDGSIPVPDATITPAGIITALIPSDSTTPPGAGVYAIDAYEPPIGAVVSELDSGVPPNAVWDFGPGVRQLIGTATFQIAATGYPGATLSVTIDEDGNMTTSIGMDPGPDQGGAGFLIDLEPSDGTIQGEVVIRTSDPDADFSEVEATTAMEAAPSPTLDLGATGTYSAGVQAGTWTTNITTSPVSNLEVVGVSAENLTDCLPPNVAPSGSPTIGTNSATFRQCVGPGGTSPLASQTIP